MGLIIPPITSEALRLDITERVNLWVGTATSITGDWDSTLTLSIVEGELVHSGYGRIRSLEIN